MMPTAIGLATSHAFPIHAAASDPYTIIVTGIPDLVAYWPLNETSGTTVRDHSGNNRNGTSSGATLGQAGQLGLAYQFTGSSLLTAGADLTAALDPTEYTCSFFINVNLNGAIVPRLNVIYTDALNNYSVVEIRATNRLDMYLRESAINQSLVELGLVPDETWIHVVAFNSESTGQSGVYLNRLYLPVGRTVPGLPVTTITATYPQFGADFEGYLQHVCWWNRLLTQSEVNSLYYGAFAAASTDITDVLVDLFTTTEAAPIASPRTAEPGPGTVTITDTAPLMSISSGNLIWTGKTVDVTTPRLFTTNTQSRVVGRAVMNVLTPGSIAPGWRATNTASPNTAAFLFQGGVLYSYIATALLNVGAVTTNGTVEYKTAHIMDRYGAFFLIKGGAFTQWTVMAASDTDAAAWYAGFGVGSASTANVIASLRVVDLPTPFNQPYEWATARLAGGRAAADAFTHDADCVLAFTLTTRPSASNVDFRFRIQDSSNYWQVTINNAGTITLNEVVAGTPTARGTAASGLNNGDRIWIYAHATRIQSTVRLSGAYTSPWTYTSATNFQAATGGLLSAEGTGGSISDIVAWPRVLGAAAAAVLDDALT